MKRLAIAAVFAAAALSGTNASLGAESSFVDGDAYLKLSSDQRTTYIMGVSDMMERMTSAVDNAEETAFLDRAHRCTDKMTGVQLRDFIDAYMAADPAYRGYGMASNYRAALNEKCPA